MDPDNTSPKSTSLSEEAVRARDTLQLLVRAQKSLRLYQTANPITARMENEVFDNLTTLVEDRGRIDLAVRNFQIFLGDEVVYENRESKESLAFLFFRDGIRSLSFFQGLELDELKAFLGCLNRAQALMGGEDDLVTMFWEQDFQSIRYLAVDELAEQGVDERVSKQLASGVLLDAAADIGGATGGEVGAPVGGSAVDVEPPVSRMPVEAAHLSESEIESLRNEIAAEEMLDMAMIVADLTVELTMIGDDAEERSALLASLIETIDQRLLEEDWESVVRIFERLVEHSRAGLEGSETGEVLAREVLRLLTEDVRAERVRALLEARPELEPREELLLRRLSDVSIGFLVGWLARGRKPVLRRAVADALLTTGTGSLPELSRQLEAMGDDPDPEFAQEVLHILRHVVHPDALPILQRLLGVADPEMRRDAALVLRHFGDKEPAKLWLGLMSDPDPQIRGLALTALARSGHPSLGLEIRGLLLGDDSVSRDTREKRRLFAVLAQVEGDQALPWLGQILQPSKKRWFLSRDHQEVLAMAAYGLRSVGTPSAEHFLRVLSDSGDRYCRAACQLELAGSARSEGDAVKTDE